MKIVFFGTPFFASSILESLINKFEIVGVVTAPDSKYGRGRKEKISDVKRVSLDNNIPVLTPSNLKDSSFVSDLANLNANLFIVVAFRMLPKIIWNMPIHGTINLHTSLLPNYRGAAPINWVLINGEKETGVTTFFINENIDEGAIIDQTNISIDENLTSADLHNKLLLISKEMIVKTISSIILNKYNKKSQDNSLAISFAPKLTKEFLQLNWNESAVNIHNKIRGLSPLLNNDNILKDVSICPSAWCFLKDKDGKKRRIKIHRSKLLNTKSDSISIKTDNKSYLNILTFDGGISILNIQPEGKKSMNIKDFLRGNKITDETKVL